MKSRRSARKDGEPPKQAAQRSKQDGERPKQDGERPIRASRRRAAEARQGATDPRVKTAQRRRAAGAGCAAVEAKPRLLRSLSTPTDSPKCSSGAAIGLAASSRASDRGGPAPQIPRTPSSPGHPGHPAPPDPQLPQIPRTPRLTRASPVPAATQLERSQLRSARPPCARPHPRTSTHNDKPSRRPHAYAHASPLTPARPDDPQSNEQS